jgi:hypothetical protein
MRIKFPLSTLENVTFVSATHISLNLIPLSILLQSRETFCTNPKMAILYVGILMHCLSSTRFKTCVHR